MVIAAIVLVSTIDNAVEEEKEYADDNCEGVVDADIMLVPLRRTAAAAAPVDGTPTNP